MKPLIVGIRYGTNLMAMAARQQGYLTAITIGGRFVLTEIIKVPKAIRLARQARLLLSKGMVQQRPTIDAEANAAELAALDLEIKPHVIDGAAFLAHMDTCNYPKNYAAGPVKEGGVREKKILEYFVSIDLLAVKPCDVVIDVASEWSLFPEVLRKLCGAKVFRQDLIYPPGMNGNRIGGNAADMPIPNEFADKLVLHNAFEHFEGTADIEFIFEAWRVLRPGGRVCILPLYLSSEYCILTDPLTDRRGVVWDEEARVIELPWCHHRFGRFYDVEALQRRVLAPAQRAGFNICVYHFLNVRRVLPQSRLHFALVLEKPQVV